MGICFRWWDVSLHSSCRHGETRHRYFDYLDLRCEILQNLPDLLFDVLVIENHHKQ